MRIFRVAPVNPLLMSGEEREKAAGHVPAADLPAARRRADPDRGRGPSGESRPSCSPSAGARWRPARARRRAASDGARDPLSLSRWRLYAALEESLRLHADSQAAVEVNHYVVVPFASAPARRARRARLRAAREAADGAARADADRAPAGGARAPRPGRRAALRARGRGDGDGAARRRAGRAPAVVVLQPDQGGPAEAPGARGGAARRARRAGRAGGGDRGGSAVARGDRRRRASTSTATRISPTSTATPSRRSWSRRPRGGRAMGWLHGAMLTRQPFTLCVYVHALERRRERQRLKLAYRRLFTINRGAESRGRVPDFDRYVQEREYEGLLGQLASGQQTGLFHVSIYEQLRARGPDPDLARCPRRSTSAPSRSSRPATARSTPARSASSGCGRATLPLGRDVVAQVRKYPTVNAADMLPLVGTKCGSPTGIPFAFADPGRTVELLNLYDELHPNHTLLIAGRSGAGKTMTANVLMSRCLALGRARVRDRPRRPLRDAVAAGRRRAADRDRRRGLAVRAEPVGRARAGEGAAREGRVPDRAAPGDDGPPRRPAARDARLGHPRGVRQGGRARQPRRPSRCCARSSAPRPTTRSRPTRRRSRRRCGTSPISCPSTAARAPTPTCSTARRPFRSTARW